MERGLPFARLSLTQSFRSTRPVLQFVDAAIDAAGEPGLGAVGMIETHASEVPGPGIVELWPPTIVGGSEDDEEGWVDDAVREQASRIARTVKSWLDDKIELGSKGRAMRPEDIMILVKRRGDLGLAARGAALCGGGARRGGSTGYGSTRRSRCRICSPRSVSCCSPTMT